MHYAIPKTTTRNRAPRSRELLRAFIKRTAGSPARLMLASWAFIVVLYFVGPLTYFHPPGLRAWSFIAGCIFTFVLGTRLKLDWRSNRARPASNQPSAVISNSHVERLVRICALVGLIGIISFIIDKVFLSGLSYSQGITTVRYERITEALSGEDRAQRSFLLYLGFLTVSFSTVSYLLYLLKAEALSRSSIWLAHLSLTSPVALSMLYGGRSPLVIVILLAIGALIVRVLNNQTLFPQGAVARRLMLAFLVLGVLYNGYILAERRLRAGVEDYNSFATNIELSAEAAPTVWAQALIESGYTDSDLFMSVLSTHFYFTHAISALDRSLEYNGALGPYYGQYQFYFVTSSLSRVYPAASFEELITREMQLAGLYGMFLTAWGGVYLDFDWPFGLVVAFVYGWLSGQAYRRAIVNQDLGGMLILCYVIGGILFSPITSPFGVSNSLPTLASILLCAWMLRSSRIRAYSARREARLDAARFVPVSLQARQQLFGESGRP